MEVEPHILAEPHIRVKPRTYWTLISPSESDIGEFESDMNMVLHIWQEFSHKTGHDKWPSFNYCRLTSKL